MFAYTFTVSCALVFLCKSEFYLLINFLYYSRTFFGISYIVGPLVKDLTSEKAFIFPSFLMGVFSGYGILG